VMCEKESGGMLGANNNNPIGKVVGAKVPVGSELERVLLRRDAR